MPEFGGDEREGPSPAPSSGESYAFAEWWTRTWEKRDPEHGQARYYQMSLQQNLWGDWELLRSWGRIGHKPSRVVLEAVRDLEAAEALPEQIHGRRLRHGYRLL